MIMKYSQPLMFVLLMGFVVSLSTAANILVYPVGLGVTSRLFNMQKLALILAEHGHNVTVLVNSRIRANLTSDKVSYVEYNISEEIQIPTKQEQQDKMNDMDMDFWITKFLFAYCKPLLEQRTLLESLKDQHFDLLFLDMADESARIISDYLGITTLLYSNHGFSVDPGVFYPVLPSFVPCGDDGESYKDRMNFAERLRNFLMTSVIGLFHPYMNWRFDQLRQEYNISTSQRSSDSFKQSLVIVPTSFALDYPRPIMPHVVLIPGLFLQEPKPLDNEWETIMKSSSDNGVIVMSIGTFFSLGQDDVDNVFSKAFARLPYTVIWKYSGPKPKHLGENTKLVESFPQNDLLAHPKVKLFITHCGVSSTYEAAQHAVPVVALPIHFDQHRNAAYLVDKAKMGVKLNLKTLTEEDLYSAIIQVLSNSTYKETAVETRDLMMDNPVPAKDLFLYWVGYVIRHKGAQHLISDAAHELNFFQYHSVDVVVFLITVCLLVLVFVLGIAYCTLKFVIRVLCGREKKKQA